MTISATLHCNHLKRDEFRHTVFKDDDGRLDFLTLVIGEFTLFVDRASCTRIMSELSAIQAEFDKDVIRSDTEKENQ